MKKLFTTMIIVALFLLVGCGVSPLAPVSEAPAGTVTSGSPASTSTPVSPTATPTPEPQTAIPTATVASDEFIASKVEDVVGIWETQFMGGVAYMQYETDGTSKLVNSLEDLEKGIIGIPGTFWFEGSVFHVADDYGEGTYELKIRKEGDAPVHLDFVEIDDPNSNRAADLTAGMTWVAPALQTSEIDEFTASKVEDVVGIWETQFMGSVGYMQYEPDGTSKLVSSLENLEKGIVGIPGTFWFEGNVLHVADNYGEGTYEVTVYKEGDAPVRLDFAEIDDPNSNRATDLTAGMAWVAPSLQAAKMEGSSPAISDEQYLIYLPEGYDEQQEPWPLLLFLHGGGGHKDGPPPELIEQGQNFPFIIVAPLMAIPNWSGDVVDNVLNEVTAQYRVDEDRIYVTGLSVGGFGTWTVASAYPERFAAIAPIAGGGDPETVEAIKHLPVWVFHGAKDDTIPLERAQEMVDALEEVGGNVTFTVYPEAGHDVWTETYSNLELYEWFLEHHR